MSIIERNPVVNELVQKGLLTRRIYQSLMESLMFRSEAEVQEPWVGNTGESRTFTGKGLIPIDGGQRVPGKDPGLVSNSKEQWEVTLATYPENSAMDIHMPTAVNAMVNLLLDEGESLGIMAGRSMNVIARDPLYNAAMEGWTVADGAQVATTSLKVARLCGFTRARRPDLPNGSPVKYSPVTASNPLRILIGTAWFNVIGYTATSGLDWDEVGPGTLTLSAAVTVADRAPIKAETAAFVWRVGKGSGVGSVDDVTQADQLRMVDIRAITVQRFAGSGTGGVIPKFADGYYHCHIHPVPAAQLLLDPEFQRLTQGMLGEIPDSHLWKKQMLGVGVGCIFLNNNFTPVPDSVLDANGNYTTDAPPSPTNSWSRKDPLGLEVWNVKQSTPVYHTLFIGRGGYKEYYQDQGMYLTDAGVTGIMGEFSEINNEGVRITTQGIHFFFRSAMNRTMDQVSLAWSWTGAFCHRPDGIVGDKARIKRVACIISG